MTAWYNEVDPFAAQWLRNLIAAGHIAPGVVDERPIQEIEAFEIAHYTQCHFFAGIGIWSYALRQAGWSDDRPIWTGSCPCQPFSQAGQQKGFLDDRHLWPYWSKIIEQCRPSAVIGEQVASALEWLDLVQNQMEAADYAFQAVDLCAAGFGGAHIRQRLYFVGLEYAELQRERPAGQFTQRNIDTIGAGEIKRLADDDDAGLEGRAGMPECGSERASRSDSLVSGVEHADKSGQQGWASGREQSLYEFGNGCDEIPAICNPRQARSLDHDNDWLLCRNPAGEPSWRPVESGTFPLAHGVAARMGKLRAYGNGLDAETAINFCEVVKEIADENGL